MNRIYYLIIVVSTIACNTPRDTSFEQGLDTSNQTPVTLTESTGDIIYSKSKRYDNDLVKKLYNEALEKDLELKKLNDKIINLPNLKEDSLKGYNNYTNTNNLYWNSVKNHIDRLEDSTLKVKTRIMFETLEKQYNNSLVNHRSKIEAINKKMISLNDQLVLMKLFISSSMFKNYQENEKPAIETLENLIIKYDSLITETKAYTK